ncbi:hypothetical protein SSPO_007780 [Streptomyces antimycoticus]|uniref:Uncharacterized protein n=1 Tax=Streptomyces antimycoticus TaxID=68175 RepID=A0A499UDY3_9ACTN|nr:hypothetical protein SSPO_007780 [Streptomyces antimycoticus]
MIGSAAVAGSAVALGAAGPLGGSGTAWAAPRAAHEAGSLSERLARAAALRWRRMPGDWKDGPFLGNGLLGVNVYRGATANSVKVMVSHYHVQDQRPQWAATYGYSRLPIGHFDLTLAGEVTDVDWTLDLWDAELTGTVTTTRGSVRFSMLVHNARTALLISTRPSAGEESAAWSFTWMPAASPRTKGKPADYTGNPDPRTGSTGETHYVEQPLIAGGGWATAWRERRVGTGRLLAAHIVYRYPDDLAKTTELAVAEVARTLAEDPDELVRAHRGWWNRFYQRSLLSVPDKRIQDFYWIQLYKAACATRARRVVHGLLHDREHHVRGGHQPGHREPSEHGPVDPRHGYTEPWRRRSGLPLRVTALAGRLVPGPARPGRVPRRRGPRRRQDPVGAGPQRGGRATGAATRHRRRHRRTGRARPSAAVPGDRTRPYRDPARPGRDGRRRSARRPPGPATARRTAVGDAKPWGLPD